LNTQSSYSGSTIGLVSGIEGDWFILENLSLQGMLGYRTATISSVTVTDSSGSGPAYGAISYGGLIASVGTAFWF
jgi:hypothetical protein